MVFLLKLFVFADRSEQYDLLNAHSDVGKDVTVLGVQTATRRKRRRETRWTRRFWVAKTKTRVKQPTVKKTKKKTVKIHRKTKTTTALYPRRTSRKTSRIFVGGQNEFVHVTTGLHAVYHTDVSRRPRTAFIEKRMCHLYPPYAKTTLSPHKYSMKPHSLRSKPPDLNTCDYNSKRRRRVSRIIT